MEQFDFPLGCYPVEDVKPIEGFTLHFEPADGGGEQDREGPGHDDDASAEFEGPTFRGSGQPGSDIDPADLDLGDLTAPDEGELREPRPDDDNHDDDDDEPEAPPARPARDSGTRERPRPDFGSAESMREGPEGGDWEEWPDRYVWDILIRASRVDALLRALYSLLPGRAFPILDVLGNDAYREIDPYVSYELVGMERFLDATRRFRGYLMEDGFVGFGVMSEEPFLYIFVDEHKMVTVRAETALKERVEAIMAAFDLKQVEALTGADAAVHEHRGVLDAPPDRPDLLTAEEIVEELRDAWGLELNVDPHRNLDDQGRELGITGWRCVVRLLNPDGTVRYLEVCLTAGGLMEAHDLAVLAAEEAQSQEEDFDSTGSPPSPPSLPPGSSSPTPGGKATNKGSPSVPGGPVPPPSRGGSSGKSGSGKATTPGAAEPGKTAPEPRKGLSGRKEGSNAGPGAGTGGPESGPDKDRDPEPGRSGDEGAIQVDVVVTDRLTPQQLEEFARELGSKGPKPSRKLAKVWAARWVDE